MAITSSSSAGIPFITWAVEGHLHWVPTQPECCAYNVVDGKPLVNKIHKFIGGEALTVVVKNFLSRLSPMRLHSGTVLAFGCMQWLVAGASQ